MTDNPEARAQLVRLAGDERLRGATAVDLEAAVESRFDALVDGLVIEAAASDDVSDSETALQYLEGRLRFFEGLLSAGQQARLRDALHAKIASW